MFDWNDFKTLAEELRQRNDEAAQRTAISRVYYAVYHRAKFIWKAKAFSFGSLKVRIGKFGTNSKTKAEPLRQSEIRATDFVQIV